MQDKGLNYTRKTVEVDIASVSTSLLVDLGAFLGAKSVSIQVATSGLTGTLNGTTQLSQSNREDLPYVNLGSPATLAANNTSYIQELTVMTGGCLKILFTKGSITAGKLIIVTVSKY